MSSALADLLEAMRRHFAEGKAQGGAVAQEVSYVLSRIPLFIGIPALPAPTHHPALRHLPAALAGNAGVLGGTVLPVAELLPWRYGYRPRPDAPGLENEMAWAEIVGPEAPIVSDSVGFGLTLIGSQTHYLPHRHPAVELYDVVVGTATWTAADISAKRSPGSFVLHPSNVVHAMRTDAEPLLAIYSWTGDIVTPTAYAGC